MSDARVDSGSVLALDFGSIHTRALLFDIVEGQYHFIAAGVASSTVDAPFYDVGECTHLAVQRLQNITGRTLLEEGHLIIPTQEDASGVDRLAVTISAGNPLKIAILGLLENVSLQSAIRLSSSTYSELVEKIGINDKRSPEEQLDSIINAKPQLILLAGGADNGAIRSVFKSVDLTALVCRLIPEGKRPVVIYCGNQRLAHKVKESLDRWTSVNISPNIRPSIDLEDLNPTQQDLAQIVGLIRSGQIKGLEELNRISGAPIMPSAYTFGRMVRFLSQIYDPRKGVLGVDVGANATVAAAGANGQLSMEVLPHGLGQGIKYIIKEHEYDKILKWIPRKMSEDMISDYLLHKQLYPASIAMTPETLQIEQAIARYLLQLAMKRLAKNWPTTSKVYEPIIGSGSVLGNAQTAQQSLLMLLDGLQPIGISTVVLDQNGIVTALGSIATINSLLPAQVLETGAFLNLGTVICPQSTARTGTSILRVQLEYEDGGKDFYEIKKGDLAVLPVQQGQIARVHLNPMRQTQIDPFHKSGTSSFKVVGGECGVVVDGRGRPLALPADVSKRRDLLTRWAHAIHK